MVGSVRCFRNQRDLRATRKPLLSFRLSGEFLLQFADWQLDASVFQLPPR